MTAGRLLCSGLSSVRPRRPADVVSDKHFSPSGNRFLVESRESKGGAVNRRGMCDIADGGGPDIGRLIFE